MALKICPMCGKEFETNNDRKICCSKKCNQQRQNKKRVKKIYHKICVFCGREFVSNRKDKKCCSIKCGQKQYKKENSLKLKEQRRKYHELNKEKDLLNSKNWKINNKEHVNEYQQQWRDNNKEYIELYNKKYYKNNKNKLLEDEKNKLKYNPNYRMGKILRNQIRYTLHSKTFHTFELLGYTNLDLKLHLESLFRDGMNWDNYGGIDGWHIDHIKPIASFNLINEDGTQNLEEIKKCWSLENLQPLWAKDNKSKGSWYDNKYYRYSKKGNL